MNFRPALRALAFALAFTANYAAAQTPWSTFIFSTAPDVATFAGTEKIGLAIGIAQTKFGTPNELATFFGGTSGAKFPFLNGNVTFSGNDTFSGTLTFSGLGAGTQVSCLGLTAANAVVPSASACGAGSGGTPGGTPGQIQYNNSSAFGGFTMAGDCTVSVPNITCTKTNGTAFGTAATQNIGTSGANIPLLNGNLTFSGADTFSSSLTLSGLSTGTQVSCLGLNSGNAIVLASSACGNSSGFPSGTAGQIAGWAATGSTGAAFSLLNGLTSTTSPATLGLNQPVATVTSSCIIKADNTGCIGATGGDMNSLIVGNISSGTITIGSISSTVFANGMTAYLANINSTSLAVASTPTISGCSSASTIYQFGFMYLTSDGAVLRCQGFAGFSGSITNNAIAKLVTGGGFASSGLSDNGTTISTSEAFSVSGTVTFGGITGSTQCLHVNSSGTLSGTGSDCGAGGSTAFSGITTGTNTTATMTVSTGATLTFSGSGVVNATEVKGDANVAFLDVTDQTLSGGANVNTATNGNLGTITTGTTTIDCGKVPLQYVIDGGGPQTIAAPANDSSCILMITNNASAGTISFSGFTVGSNTGDALTTTNGNKFQVSIRRINGVSAYAIQALQ